MIFRLTSGLRNGIVDALGTKVDGGAGAGTIKVYTADTGTAITNATWSGGVATITSTSHGLVVGDFVDVSGVTPTGYNVRKVVATVPGANSFTIPITSDPGAYSSGGTAAKAMPTTAADAVIGTLLATLTFADPSFGAGSSGTATANAIVDDSSADATGTASYARIEDSTGADVMDVDITATGGAGGITFNTIAFQITKTVSMDSFTFTCPATMTDL